MYEIITSAHNLKNETAFWGYAWRIAENTLRRFLRKTAIITVEWTDVNAGSYAISPEEEFIRKEEEADTLYLLRRELSLLKKLHREICIAYYIDGKKMFSYCFRTKNQRGNGKVLFISDTQNIEGGHWYGKDTRRKKL